MGRVKEWQLEEERVKQERAEAAYFALPEAQTKALAGIYEILHTHTELVEQNASLKVQLTSLQLAFESATGAMARWKERSVGFLLGCAASVAASFIWWRITKQWTLFT